MLQVKVLIADLNTEDVGPFQVLDDRVWFL